MSKDDVQRMNEAKGGGVCAADRVVVRPHVVIREDEAEYVLRADVPGVSQEGVNVTVEDDMLTLEAVTDVDAAYQVGPRDNRTYRHVVSLNDRVDPKGVKGQIKHGVLVVHLPKRKELTPRKVEILAA